MVPTLFAFHAIVNLPLLGTNGTKCHVMKRKHYSAPSIEIVEANLTSSILVDSKLNTQVEDGVWNGLDDVESNGAKEALWDEIQSFENN